MGYAIAHCYFSPFIHSAMSLSTSGAMVSSIFRYSFMLPVVQCWKRWFRPGYSFVTLFLDFGRLRSMAVKLSEEMTCQSR